MSTLPPPTDVSDLLDPRRTLGPICAEMLRVGRLCVGRPDRYADEVDEVYTRAVEWIGELSVLGLNLHQALDPGGLPVDVGVLTHSGEAELALDEWRVLCLSGQKPSRAHSGFLLAQHGLKERLDELVETWTAACTTGSSSAGSKWLG